MGLLGVSAWLGSAGYHLDEDVHVRSPNMKEDSRYDKMGTWWIGPGTVPRKTGELRMQSCSGGGVTVVLL